MSQASQCPDCGAEIPAGPPAGQCPQCLMKAGFQSEASLDSQIEPTAPSPGSAGFEPPLVDHLARLFPQLEILELLGRGGMGAVYKARQPGLNRLVAVKILPPEVGSDPAFAQRFTREAQALAHLNHPNIVAVHDFGQADGQFYFVMEYVDGLNLRQAILASKLTPDEALAIVPQICDALQYAHDEGVVHRDIKPENVLLDSKGRVKIADFGLAKLLGHETADFTLTHTHQVMGTPRYMAPEQMTASHNVDHRADIYSLGVVFYELLTGEVPMGRFEAPSKRVRVDVRLDEIVLRTLEREPDRRYQKASELKTDVQSVTSNPAVAQMRRPVADDLPASEDDLAAARQEVKVPAIGLMVVGVLMCLLAVVPMCVGGGLMFRWWAVDYGPSMEPEMSPYSRDWEGGNTAPLAEPPTSLSEPTLEAPPPIEDDNANRDTPEPEASGCTPTATLLAIAATGQQGYDESHAGSASAPRADAPVAWFAVVAIVGSVFFVLIPLAVGILTTLAGWRMMHLQSHGLAVTASILALLPCQPVFLLSLIFGIWSLVVLNRPHVKAAFKASAKNSHEPQSSGTIEESRNAMGQRIAGELDDDYARRRMKGPAVALMIAAVVNILGNIVLAGYFLSSAWTTWDYVGAIVFPGFAIAISFILMGAAGGLLRLETSPAGDFAITVSLITFPGLVIAIPAVLLYWVRSEDPRVKGSIKHAASDASSPPAHAGGDGIAMKSGRVNFHGPAELLIAAAIMALLTGIGILVWWFATGEFDAQRLYHSDKGSLQWNMIGIAGTHGLYALLIGSAGMAMLARRARLFVLLLVIIIGLLLPATLAVNCLTTYVREWPALIPLWLGMPVALWGAVTLLRGDVREEYRQAAARRTSSSKALPLAGIAGGALLIGLCVLLVMRLLGHEPVGDYIIYDVAVEDSPDATSVDMDALVQAVDRRVNSGYANVASVSANESGATPAIEIAIYGEDLTTKQQILRRMEAQGTLELRLLAHRAVDAEIVQLAEAATGDDVIDSSSGDEATKTPARWVPATARWLEQQIVDEDIVTRTSPEGQTQVLLLLGSSDVLGSHVDRAKVVKDDLGFHALSVSFNAQGAQRMAKLTGENISTDQQARYLAIMIDGRLESSPRIMDRVSGEALLTGRFTREEAEDLAAVLQAGALPAKLTLSGRTLPSRFDGQWVCTYMERDGAKVMLDRELVGTFTGEQFVAKQGGQIVVAGTSKVDPNKRPQEIDTTYTAGENQRQTFKGIRKIEGDKITFCRAGSPNDPRPTQFKTRPGSGELMTVYQKRGR